MPGSGAPAHRARRALTFLLALLAMMFIATSAEAGRSSTGVLAFYPCTQCHPVTLGPDGEPTSEMPIGIARHQIVLEVHDVLGTDDAACLACHDDPARNPGKLVLPDGSFVDITGDVSRVCQTCHFEKYREWQDGVHGKDAPKCTASGCHDPHTPSWIYMPALPPFQGTGIEVRAVSEREPFTPLAAPPLAPPVFTPVWLGILAGLAAAVSVGIIGYLALGGRKR